MTDTKYNASRGAPGNTKEYNPTVLDEYDKVFATESKIPTFNAMIKPETTNTPYETAF